jgi:integrase
MSAPRVPGITLRFDPKRAAGLGWGVFVDVRLNGKRHSPSKFFATEEEAERAYRIAAATVAAMRAEVEQDARLKQALAVPPLPQAPKGTVLFETMAKDWLEKTIKPPRRTASTYRGYKGLLERHLFPIMRSWPVNAEVMKPLRLTDVLREDLYKKGVSLSTRVACQRCLSAFFVWAKKQLPAELPYDNPALKLAIDLRMDAEITIRLRQEPNPMTRVQVEDFLAWIKDHYRELWEFFVWLADAGSRVGEVSALKWEHIDVQRGKAHIIDAFSYAHLWWERQQGNADGRGENAATIRTAPPRKKSQADGEKDTKTHRSNQYIDLSDRVVEMLPDLKTRNLEAWMAVGRPGKEPEHVFLNSKLRPRRPDSKLYKAFRAACDTLGLVGQTGEPFTVHCLRDTFATLAILEGKLDLGWVALMLGHATEETLKKHYFKYVRLVADNPLRRKTGGDK